MAAEGTSNQEGLGSIEHSVMIKSAEEHEDELEVVDKAFQCILEGFRVIKDSPDSEQEIEIQEGRMLLAVRVFKSLRSARLLCQSGYYEQSLMLVRSSMEHLLVAWDIGLCKETLNALKSGHRLIGGKVRAAMLDRVAAGNSDPNFKKTWNWVYKLLNEYVHPGGSHRQQIPFPGGVTGYAIPFVSHYDKKLSDPTLFFIEQNLLGLLLLVEGITFAAGKEWDFEEIAEELHRKYQGRLGTMFPLAPPKGAHE